MQLFLARARVLLTAAPTWLLAASLVAVQVAQQVATLLPAGWQDNALSIGGSVAAVLTGAIAIVRRVTPVINALRGLLPPS